MVKEDWEKEIDERFGSKLSNTGVQGLRSELYVEIKQFIRNLLK